MRDRTWFIREDDLENDFVLLEGWVLLEGKMTPKFLHLEDNNFALLLEELNIDGSLVSDVGPILQHLYDFYSELYTRYDAKSIDEIDAFLDSLPELPKVIGDTLALSTEITCGEVEAAIRSLHLGKLPGCDGLTAAFYKYFAGQLTELLAAVMNDCFKNKSLTVLQYLAIIILLFKKGQQSLPTTDLFL